MDDFGRVADEALVRLGMTAKIIKLLCLLFPQTNVKSALVAGPL